MGKLQLFNYQDKEVRVIQKNGQEWWIAQDVCNILELSNVSDSIKRLDEDEKLISVLSISGQERDTWTINEFGLYSLILSSRKPEAKNFKRWITHEVIPSIRKTGSYSVDPSIVNATKLYKEMLPSLQEAHATPKDLTECMIKLVQGIEKKERKELQKKQKKLNISRERQEILDLFSKYPGQILHPLEVSRLLSKSFSSVLKIMWRMGNDGLLGKRYKGEYYLSEDNLILN